jgi:uncharacterized protein YheU (UPF0270 family)
VDRDANKNLAADSVSGQPREPLVVPHTELAVDVLRGVVESVVLREGTEYGEKEFSLEEKVAQLTRQLQLGAAQIVFDPTSQTVDIVAVGVMPRR